MFVVWRREAVQGGGGCAILAGDGQGDEVPAWRRGLRCDHGGEGRVAHTPLLMRAERVDGKPRQRLVKRLPTIRSCCIADPFTAAAWWRHLDDLAAAWKAQAAGPHGEVLGRFAHDEAIIRAKLREVVPMPDDAARGKFDEHCAARDRQDEERRRGNEAAKLLEEEARKVARRRERDDPIEQAKVWDELIRTLGISIRELGDRIGYKHSIISRTLLLLKLPPEIQRRVSAGAISVTVGAEIARLSDPAEQVAAATEVESGKLTREQARARNDRVKPRARAR